MAQRRAARVWAGVGVGLGLGAGLATSLGAGRALVAQMHKVQKPETVVRAVGVYEWTGDLGKTQASRLVPVTVYIGGELQDAGTYLPQPIPFALQPGNAYELQQAGVSKGLLELQSAGKLPGTESFDNVWFGYGTYKPAPPPSKTPALRASKTLSPITTAKDDSRPHFGGSSGDAGGAKDAGNDPQGSKADSDSKVDPDRPTLKRRSNSGKAGADGSASGSTPATDAGIPPPDDPDRPVLKRRTNSSADKSNSGTSDVSASREVATEALNNDPNRPTLHRGRPTGSSSAASVTDEDVVKISGTLSGLPKDFHQLIAVSDAANRPEHDFIRPWTDDNERKTVLARMQALAQVKLAAYNTDTGAVASTPAAPATTAKPGTAGKSAPPATPAARRRAALAAAAARKKAAASSVALLDEDLRGYTLSYGGAPTYIYMAHTGGTGAALRYVTVVAQQDVFGEVQPAFSNVTDAAHLDRTPWMRLVGVVDVEASNRASLLFEMREQGTRQFALYRVLGSRSEPIFTSGTTQ